MKRSILLVLMVMFCLSNRYLYSLVLDQPQTFVLGYDLVDSSTALVIATSNIVVDLNSHTVAGSYDGIVLEPDVFNVTICNGYITSSTHTAITIGEGCSQIELKDLNIAHCPNTVFSIKGTATQAIQYCIIKDCAIYDCCNDVDTDVLFDIYKVNDLIMRNCYFNNNGSEDGNLNIINVQDCQRCIFEKINMQSNIGNTLQCCVVDNSENCKFDRCLIEGNTADGIFKGFLFSNNANSNTVFNSRVSNNTANTDELRAYDVSSDISQNLLSNSTALANKTLSAKACYGFYIDKNQECSFLQCKAVGNRVLANGGTDAIAVGFNIANGTQNCRFFRCEASGNNAFNDNKSYGIRAINGTGTNKNNIYVGNLGASNGPSNPSEGNQIVTTAGQGKDNGGIPSGTVMSVSNSAYTSDLGSLLNIRIY